MARPLDTAYRGRSYNLFSRLVFLRYSLLFLLIIKLNIINKKFGIYKKGAEKPLIELIWAWDDSLDFIIEEINDDAKDIDALRIP